MKTVKIQTFAKQALSIDDLKGKDGTRRMGFVYYQHVNADRFVARVISKETNVAWLKDSIKAGKIFIPCATILAEVG